MWCVSKIVMFSICSLFCFWQFSKKELLIESTSNWNSQASYQFSDFILKRAEFFKPNLQHEFLYGKNQGSIGRHTLTLSSFIAISIDVMPPKQCPLTVSLSRSNLTFLGNLRTFERKSLSYSSLISSDTSYYLILSYQVLAAKS